MSLSLSTFRRYWIGGIILAVSFVQLASPAKIPSSNGTLLDSFTSKNITVGAVTLNTAALECGKRVWLPIFRFFLINYLGHAFTVRLGAGYGSTYGILFALLSLFHPYFGLLLACRAMECFALGEDDPLRRALRGGALCVVARTNKWKPEVGDKAWVWRVFPPSESSGQQQGNLENGENFKKINYGGLELEYLSQKYVHVHGLCDLPPGYMLARLPSDYMVKWQELEEDTTIYDDPTDPEKPGEKRILDTKIKISSSYSVMKSIIALFQLGSAIPTIWAVSKPENRKYGYAAYQLTVIPYALMSIINTITGFTTPHYPASYLVRSSIMDEAKKRGGRFEGVIGELCESETKVSLKSNGTRNWTLVGAVGEFISGAEGSMHVRFTEGEEPMHWPDQSSPGGEGFFHAIKKALIFIFRQQIWEGLREEAPIARWPARWHERDLQDQHIVAMESTDSPSRRVPRESSTSGVGAQTSEVSNIIRITPHRTSIVRLFKIFTDKKIALLPAIGNPIPRKKDRMERFLYYVSDLTVFICLAAPYLVTFGLTSYKNGQSTLFQRVIAVLWVVMMQIAYIPQRLTWSFLQTRIAPLSDKKLAWALVSVTLPAIIWSIPAMAGFVNVALMMHDRNGTCPDYGQYNSPS